MVTNCDAVETKVYELALLVKEVREEPDEYFHFYVMGDFWDKKQSESHPIFKWTLVDLEIQQSKLLDLDSPEE